MATSAAPNPRPLTERWRARPMWARSDVSGWRTFCVAILALAGALVLALYSSALAQGGNPRVAALIAVAALGVAGWVALTIVPKLARRTQLRWLAVPISYKLTREGVVCLATIMIVALAALNTGNNLLFMILASMLAAVVVSGVLSHAVLTNVDVRLELPENIFAGQNVVTLVELTNRKQTLPSFSLRLVSDAKKAKSGESAAAAGARLDAATATPSGAVLTQPVYFPFIPRRKTAHQNVELRFAQRGVYRQDTLGLQTKFPFGFLQKARTVDSSVEAVVYPSVEPTEEFYEILPLVSGELESFMRGRGHDLYAIRDYQTSDSARHVDWKASAKTGALQVREFAREDERRVLLVFDPFLPASAEALRAGVFERGVTLCASLAWHFYEIDSVLAFRTAGYETPMRASGEIIYDILGHLAGIQPQRSEADRSFLHQLGDSPQVFKIILTAQPRGSIPTSLWSSSYILFLDRWK
jgi:uncharacterized protein (DUF58 family)